nr:hypothetical protein [uncultured Halomonas sp.]
MTTATHVPVKQQNLPLMRHRYAYITTSALVSREGHEVPEGTFLLCIDSGGGTSPTMVSDAVNDFQPMRFATSQRAHLRPLEEDSALQHLLPLIYDAFLGKRLPTLDAPLRVGDVIETNHPIPLADGVKNIEVVPRGTVMTCVREDGDDGFTYMRFYHPLEYTDVTVGVSSVLLSLVATHKALPELHKSLANLGVSLTCRLLEEGGFSATFDSDGASVKLTRQNATSEVVVVKGDAGAMNRLMDKAKSVFARPSGRAWDQRTAYEDITAKTFLTLVVEYALDWGQVVATPYEWRRLQTLKAWRQDVIDTGGDVDLHIQ